MCVYRSSSVVGGGGGKVGGGVQSLGGPPVEGLYDHHNTASPVRTSTPFLPGELHSLLCVASVKPGSQ